MFESSQLDHAAQILDHLIQIEDRRGKQEPIETFHEKLDRLSQLIDALRFHTNYYDRQPEASGRTMGIAASLAKAEIYFIPSKGFTSKRVLTPEHLALPLLGYLYHNPGRGRRVLTIIHGFIRSHIVELQPEDFERTATGVLRIVTNVRFAARRLRENGLLQFTHAEAFKTWRLSFLGILVAGGWGRQPDPDELPSSFLIRGKILASLCAFDSLPALTKELKAMCERCEIPASHVCEIQRIAADTLREYRRILSSDLNESSTKHECERLLVQLSHSDPVQRLVEAWDRPEGDRSTLV